MSRYWKSFGAVLLVIAGLMLTAGAVFAQGPVATTPAPVGNAAGYHGGMGAGWRWAGNSGNLLSVLAEKLGVSTTDLIAQVQSGKTLLDIAAENGISVDELTAAMLESRAEALQAAVEAGRISQEQADYMLENMSEHMATQIATGQCGGLCGTGLNRGGRFGGTGAGAGAAFVDADGDGICDNLGTRLGGRWGGQAQ